MNFDTASISSELNNLSEDDFQAQDENILVEGNITLAEEKKNLGNNHFKAQNYAEAIVLYSDAINACPGIAVYYCNRAACHMMLSNYDSALGDARSAVRLDPKFAKAYVRVVKCCLAKGDLLGCQQALKAYKELSEDDNMTLQHEEEALGNLRELEVKIDLYWTKKSYRNVIFYIDSALKFAPACLRYSLLKAECFVYLDRCDEASNIAIYCMKMDGASADAVYLRGLCLYYTDNIEKGILHFERALQLDPDHQRAKEARNRAKLLKSTKDVGNEFFNKGKYAEAENAYTEALRIDPLNKIMNSKLYFNRALVHSKTNAYNKAIDDCTKVLEISENYLKALLLRARCYRDVAKYQECIVDYEAALRLNKNSETKKLLHEAKVLLKNAKRKDYYKILGLTRNATQSEIKKAYRKKALMYHPDRHASGTQQERLENEIKFKEVGEAYAVLTDKRRKARFDSGHELREEDMDYDPNELFRHFFNFGGSNNSTFSFEL